MSWQFEIQISGIVKKIKIKYSFNGKTISVIENS